MTLTQCSVGAMLALGFSAAVMAQTAAPTKGAYLCKMEVMHMMPGKGGTAMINAARCALDGNEKNTLTFTNNVMFDEKGMGKLINSNGLTMQEGKPVTAFIGNQSTWSLKMQDGKMVGYTANGVNDIVAGQYVGKKIHWTAAPTGPDTANIDYEIK